MESVTTLYEEYRLIERSENEVNGAWKGAHLLLFFLAFVFGSFCTFCFHMLMFMFDEKCVLFPKLLSLASLKNKVLYDFIPKNMQGNEGDEDLGLPVDFVNTQWVEQSACYLPTFVPLASGIFGLVWTTMFLMCSTDSRNHTGLQRSWRVVPPVFVFSLAMSCLCMYSSVITHSGLRELCLKLGEITGNSGCSYTVNVATLVYENRIRGVFQATWLTIISAWVHTICWILSTLVALLRILLAVDFQLVRVSVNLLSDLDKILEKREKQIRTVSPNSMLFGDNAFETGSSDSSDTKIHYTNKGYCSASRSSTLRDRLRKRDCTEDADDLSRLSVLFFTDEPTRPPSKSSLVPEERNKLDRLEAYHSVPKDKKFIVKMLYDLLDNIEYPTSSDDSPILSLSSSSLILTRETAVIGMTRQLGQEIIVPNKPRTQPQKLNLREAEEVAKEIRRNLHERLNHKLSEIKLATNSDDETPSTSKKRGHIAFESTMNITEEMKRNLKDKLDKSLKDSGHGLEGRKKKSNLKNRGSGKNKKGYKKSKLNVKISDSNRESSSSESGKSTIEKETQTRPKEKQD